MSSSKAWRDLPRELTKQMVKRNLRRWLEENPLHVIRTSDGHIVRLAPFEFQRKVIETWRNHKITGAIGGNRLGKSLAATLAMVESAVSIPWERWQALPRDPALWPLGPPKVIWCVTLTFEKSRDGQQQFLWERIPRKWFDRSTWHPKNGFHNNVAALTNGTRFVFKTEEQGLRSFETVAVDEVWLDESVGQAILLACLPRLIDRRGRVLWTSIFDDPFLDDLFIRRQIDPMTKKQLSPEDVAFVGGGMRENPFLPPAEIDRYEAITPAIEREFRIHGRPAFRQGLTYSEYDERLHDEVMTWPVAADWVREEIIDPGWDNPCAVLFGGIDRYGVLHGYDELYERHRTVGEMAARIYLKRWIHRGLMTPREILEYEGLIAAQAEPAWDLSEQARRDGRLMSVIGAWKARYGPCAPRRVLIDEYAQQRDQAKPVNVLQQFAKFGIVARPASNRDKLGQELKVHELLSGSHGRVKFKLNADCYWQKFEFTHYRTGKKDETTGQYLDDREKRVRAHNHLISCWEYWAASEPRWAPGDDAGPLGWPAARRGEDSRKAAMRRRG